MVVMRNPAHGQTRRQPQLARLAHRLKRPVRWVSCPAVCPPRILVRILPKH